MAEVNTNKLGFYKDNNWYTISNQIQCIYFSTSPTGDYYVPADSSVYITIGTMLQCNINLSNMEVGNRAVIELAQGADGSYSFDSESGTHIVGEGHLYNNFVTIDTIACVFHIFCGTNNGTKTYYITCTATHNFIA